MTRAEYLEMKRRDKAEFMINWNHECGNYPGGWVPPHMIAMTGMILRELERDGEIETDGTGYRPA